MNGFQNIFGEYFSVMTQNLFQELGIGHESNDWHFFIDSSSQTLNTNTKMGTLHKK